MIKQATERQKSEVTIKAISYNEIWVGYSYDRPNKYYN